MLSAGPCQRSRAASATAASDSRNALRPLAFRGEREQVAQELREPLGLRLRRLEVARDLGIVGLQRRRLQSQPQAGQRRAQLMRRIGDELALGAERTCEPVGHLVERGGDLALLARATDRGALVQLARGDAPRRDGQAAQRPCERAGEEPGHRQAEQERDDADPDQRRNVLAHLVLDAVDRLGHAHRAGRSPCLDHGHRGDDQVLVERVAVPGALEGRAGERTGHLGAAPRRRSSAGRLPAESSSRLPSLSTTITRPPRSDAALLTSRASSWGRSSRPAALAASSWAWSLRLGLDLGVHAAAEVQRERHLERDQHHHQHVGEGQQQAAAEGHCSASSAAAKRKPTPRTVCM